MKKTLLERMVRQEVRRSLKPMGLLGKKGPAKNIPGLVRREVKAQARPCSIASHCFGLALGGSL